MNVVRGVAGGACLGLVLANLAGCAAAPRQRAREGGPVGIGAGTLTVARNLPTGGWSLESFQVVPAGKPPVTVKGQGIVNYDEYSDLTMDVRADAASVEVLKAAGIEVVNNGFSTTGRAV